MLKDLIEDMRHVGWIIELFPFTYNDVECTVVLKLYEDGQRKPNKYAQAALEFIRLEDELHLKGHCNLTRVSFESVVDFYKFFNIKTDPANDDVARIFENFSDYFINHVPNRKRRDYSEKERDLIGGRLDVGRPGKYCFNVARNGNNGQRSIENSNKAELYRPQLFERFKDDQNISFHFSTDPNAERSDVEIRDAYANRAL